MYVDPKTNPQHATRFLQHVNHGALANKHLGLRNAGGKTATRVPNALVKMLARLQTTVVQYIVCLTVPDATCIPNTATFSEQLVASPVQLNHQV